MSGTLRCDGGLFPWDPLESKWERERLATRGDGQPKWSDYWAYEATLPHEATSDWDFWFSRFIGPGPHAVVLPHPGTESLTLYSGVAFDVCEAAHREIGGWFFEPRIRFSHIYLSGGVPW